MKSPYFRLLARDPDALRARTLTDKDIFYNADAGLPRAEAEHMASIITGINAQGMTVLLVEHNMRMVMSLSHDILVLNNGVRIAEGTADAVCRHPDVLTAYLGAAADA